MGSAFERPNPGNVVCEYIGRVAANLFARRKIEKREATPILLRLKLRVGVNGIECRELDCVGEGDGDFFCRAKWQWRRCRMRRSAFLHSKRTCLTSISVGDRCRDHAMRRNVAASGKGVGSFKPRGGEEHF